MSQFESSDDLSAEKSVARVSRGGEATKNAADRKIQIEKTSMGSWEFLREHTRLFQDA